MSTSLLSSATSPGAALEQPVRYPSARLLATSVPSERQVPPRPHPLPPRAGLLALLLLLLALVVLLLVLLVLARAAQLVLELA
eukprot:CAMPEP_0206168596 /NCGR_PEP_ID=MMETSP1474-20131121/32698_1 /ASSEMBLY_ACC=CAM_ASM_001110 /TAXON_ID=97495 /ORGANISM="Imantonia sp., Strain RCC918" /LENGTH=82 /DNA_ID=CAMNT_0053574085 /DNA_START=105 /DNA_END=350 /DNA_ORIENTATION=+